MVLALTSAAPPVGFLGCAGASLVRGFGGSCTLPRCLSFTIPSPRPLLPACRIAIGVRLRTGSHPPWLVGDILPAASSSANARQGQFRQAQLTRGRRSAESIIACQYSCSSTWAGSVTRERKCDAASRAAPSMRCSKQCWRGRCAQTRRRESMSLRVRLSRRSCCSYSSSASSSFPPATCGGTWA